MKKSIILITLLGFVFLSARYERQAENSYSEKYYNSLERVVADIYKLQQVVENERPEQEIRDQLHNARTSLKAADIWLRYFHPIAYKKLNAPLPVEWEVEVLEKWESPYERKGAGLTLFELYLEEDYDKDSAANLLKQSLLALKQIADTSDFYIKHDPQQMHYANRLWLLNLASIYTTGFECPNTDSVIVELQAMMESTHEVLSLYNDNYPSYSFSEVYMEGLESAIQFVKRQPKDFELFDHFIFLRHYINPLYGAVQRRIQDLGLKTSNVNDFSLNPQATSIFGQNVYRAQETMGLFKGLDQDADKQRLWDLGELLFYDPVLSGNNQRSCISCHKPSDCFTENEVKTSMSYDGVNRLERNTPSLLGVLNNHLLMLDGRHIHPLRQANDVIHNQKEMGSTKGEVFKEVMKIKHYRKEFKYLSSKVLNDELSVDHIYSALIYYYSSFDERKAPFDQVINNEIELPNEVQQGYNLFMSKAECGTCHFLPEFNGVKPPYVGSEFEVIGTPKDTLFSALSEDLGRGDVHNVAEMTNAFRTPTLRNLSCTQPYMHNGVFETLEEVVDFYNEGGGAGKGLVVDNQTLNSEKLNLTKDEIAKVVTFLKALDEGYELETKDMKLPRGRWKLKKRKTEY